MDGTKDMCMDVEWRASIDDGSGIRNGNREPKRTKMYYITYSYSGYLFYWVMLFF